MIWVDYILLVIIAVSALLSLWRGFMKEAISLVSWIAALWVGMLFFYDLARVMRDWIDTPTIRNVVAFGLLFIGTLVVGGLVNYLVGQLVSRTGLTSTDRILGMIFGVARGVVVVAVLVMLAGLTTVPQDPWWQESTLLEYFQDIALWLRAFLPDDIKERIRF
ncbi:MAG: CvpA family protein [Gammaproteobacteria bacterium]|nr:MAG: CvpA family protein [Gammaproteobacteria bacterium]